MSESGPDADSAAERVLSANRRGGGNRHSTQYARRRRKPPESILTEYLFQLPQRRPDSPRGTLQARIREMLVNAIIDGRLPPDAPLPSSRKLARQLAVARNTVMAAYQHLADEGFLTARARSGYYVNGEILKGRAAPGGAPAAAAAVAIDWREMLAIHPRQLRDHRKPANWHEFPYPFICGQYDRELFPIADWRECCREAASVRAIHGWARDHIDRDNPALVEQIRAKILPRRGLWAQPEEILVTIGAQQGIFLTAQLLLDRGRTVGVESPGYVDAENTFSIFTPRVEALAVDRHGLVPDAAFARCDCVYATPSHQYPTTVTMPQARRMELLQQAHKHDVILVEDDYESEFNYVGEPSPALKSLDADGRVIYIGSLSKTLAPGIRLGYLVGAREFIRQARALRRLMLRHPPSNNQFIIAKFLERGYHDAMIARLSHALHARWKLLGDLLETHFPGRTSRPTFGGSSFWVKGPAQLDAGRLATTAAAEGKLLFEPGEIFFHGPARPKNFFRLGFSSIPEAQILDGFKLLVRMIRSC